MLVAKLTPGPIRRKRRFPCEPSRCIVTMARRMARHSKSSCPGVECSLSGFSMESGTLAASLRPAKLSRLDWDSCLCHSELGSSRSEQLTSFRKKSWTFLLYAAGIRKDRLSVFLSENGADPAVPRGFYHCKCYQTTRTSTNWRGWQQSSLSPAAMTNRALRKVSWRCQAQAQSTLSTP